MINIGVLFVNVSLKRGKIAFYPKEKIKCQDLVLITERGCGCD
jgi:hypothetical protein